MRSPRLGLIYVRKIDPYRLIELLDLILGLGLNWACHTGHMIFGQVVPLHTTSTLLSHSIPVFALVTTKANANSCV